MLVAANTYRVWSKKKKQGEKKRRREKEKKKKTKRKKEKKKKPAGDISGCRSRSVSIIKGVCLVQRRSRSVEFGQPMVMVMKTVQVSSEAGIIRMSSEHT